MRSTKLLLSLLCVCLVSVAFIRGACAQDKKRVEEARILVGPNLLVSRNDAHLPHAETMIAANPQERRNLLGASIVFTHEVHGTTCKTYASRDGGQTWIETAFPERVAFGSADPQVAFGLHGTAYFLMVSAGEAYPIHFYRSEEGGVRWESARTLRGGDHPQMVVDHSTGRFAGRVYITGMYGVRNLAVSRSEDDGRRFIGPVEVPNPRGFFLLTMNPLIFSDGTLFIPYLAWDDVGGRTPPATVSEFVTSSDGGVTFSSPTRVLEQPFRKYVPPTELRGSFIAGMNVVYAIDRRNDRLYVAASDDRAGSRRMLLSYSSDRGRTWSALMKVSPDVPAASAQYQPMLAVNPEGTVGVAWFDTRDAPNRDSYHLYFTASVDGGKSFLPARRVSSEPSLPINAINLMPFQGSSRVTQGNLEQRFRTAFGRWGNGGDYMGFTADADGFFRPLWIDSRSGVFQVWTNLIRVLSPGGNIPTEMTGADNLRQISLIGKVRLVIDPPRYDAIKQEVTMPIRLQNISTEQLYGPFSVEVKSSKEWTILNAVNGQSGAGAVFDYAAALGDWRSLAPRGVTEAVTWRFRYSGISTSPTIEVEIKGYAR